MNEFEKNPQTTRKDVPDAGIGFGASFVFFSLMFIIATVIEYVSR